MDNNKQDKNLQAPQEANTEKHINFREVQEADQSSERSNTSTNSNDDSPTKKAWEELRDDNKKEGSE